MISKTSKFFIIFFSLFFLHNCSAFRPASTKDVPTNAAERAKKNVEEGRGVSIKNILGNRSTNYEFSTSNPMWKATLEVLDFLPLAVVDYSGGVIITDWYNAGNANDYLKILIRFTSNEVRTDSLKIIVHKKSCKENLNCSTKEIKSKINEELLNSIIKKAAILEKQTIKK